MSFRGEGVAVRGRRVRGHRRWARVAAVVCGVVAGLCALAAFGSFRASKREAEAKGPAPRPSVTATQAVAARPVYPYSVIPGGARSGPELNAHVKADTVVRDHYQEFDLARTRAVRLDAPRTAYVSYRRGSDIFWTRRPVTIPAGEMVLTDGRHMARARCGNRIEDTPGRVSVLEPLPHELDIPQGTLSLSDPKTIARRFATPGPFEHADGTPDSTTTGFPGPSPRPQGIGVYGPGGGSPRTVDTPDTPSGGTESDEPGVPRADDAPFEAPQIPGAGGSDGHGGDPSSTPHGGPSIVPGGHHPGGGGDHRKLPDPPDETRPPGSPDDPMPPPGPPVHPPDGGDVPDPHWPPEGEGGSGTVPEPGMLLLIAGGGAAAIGRRLRLRRTR